MCQLIKTGKYVNLHCLTFHKLQTELKYQDYSSTSCILKKTRFLNRKCRKLGVSDDVIRKIVTSARKKLCKMVWRSLLIQSFIAIAHSYPKLYRGGAESAAPPPIPEKLKKAHPE